MKTKTIIKVVLLGFVVTSLGWLFIQQSRDETAEGTSTSVPDSRPAGDGNPSVSARPDRVIVYYFHTTYRCPTCHKIENYTKEAVETGFSQALRDGRLVFQVLNVEEAPNAHFVQDYQLHTKSVVVVDIKNGQQARWKNLTKVWELVGKKEDFLKYIRDEVNLYLQGK